MKSSSTFGLPHDLAYGQRTLDIWTQTGNGKNGVYAEN